MKLLDFNAKQTSYEWLDFANERGINSIKTWLSQILLHLFDKL